MLYTSTHALTENHKNKFYCSPGPATDLRIIFIPNGIARGVQPAATRLTLNYQFAIRVWFGTYAAHH